MVPYTAYAPQRPIAPPPQQQGAVPLAPQPVIPGTGRGVALLAPLTGANAERGQALVNAARLALGGTNLALLDVRDTGGTAAGAANAARQVIAAGAGLIIGPLTAVETAGAASVARGSGVAMLAFTNDPTQAQPGVWTLGITPAQQVRRLVGAVLGHGQNRFAAVLPQNDFGSAMGAALTQALAGPGVPPPKIATYDPTGPMDAAARDIADYSTRVAPLLGEVRPVVPPDASAAPAAAGAATAPAAPAAPPPPSVARPDVPPPAFDALLLAENGPRLATLVGLLQNYEVRSPPVRLLGSALWADAAARGTAALNGAWFAAPDQSLRGQFADQYTAAYGRPAPGFADLAYDAASIGRVLLQRGGGFTVAALCQPDGFAGVDGLFALQPDGTVRRGLALFEIHGASADLIEPAPTTMTAPGI